MYLRRLYFLAALNNTQWHSAYQMNKIQGRKLISLLNYAYKNVEYYRELFNSVGFMPDSQHSLEKFSRIPVTTKQDLRNAGLDGIFAKKAIRGNCIKKFTSGSSGEPFNIYFCKRDHDALAALAARCFINNGLNFFSRRIEIGNVAVLEERQSFLNKMGFWQTKNVPTFLPEQEMVSLINSYRPNVIVGYPSALELLSRYVIDNKKDVFTPRAVFCRSELLGPGTRSLIEKAFETEVFDFFGCQEVGLFAFECSQHSGYHISQDTCITEFINLEGK